MNKRQEIIEHRGEVPPDAELVHQAALLIDFDNVTMGIRSNLGQELRNLLNSDVIRGKVAVQRAYADWRRYPQYIVPLSESSIDLIFAPAYGSSKKNATDIRLAIDALELVFIRPEIRTFILMSGDSDFSSLVLKLKEYGKYVIGVGIQESSSDLLVQNCDEYYSYSALSGLSKEGEQPTERHDPWVLVEKAIDKMVERGDTMRSDRLKQVMLEIDPSFSEKEQGFSKFNRFVVEAASRGLISIQKMENGQYGVAPPGKSAKTGKSGTAKSEREERKGRRNGGQRGKERERKERQREKTRSDRPEAEKEETRRARPKLTMQSALDLLNRVLDRLLDGPDDEVRDSDVKRRLLELQPDFDEGELGFSKFSKFLQAAEEKNAVRLTRGPSGNYHVRRPASDAAESARRPDSKAAESARRSASDAAESARRPEKRRAEQPQSRKPEVAASADRAEDEAQTTVQRLARFLFGGKKEDQEAAERAISRQEPKEKSRGESATRRPERSRPQAEGARKKERPRREHRRRGGDGGSSGERRRQEGRGSTRGRPGDKKPRDQKPRREPAERSTERDAAEATVARPAKEEEKVEATAGSGREPSEAAATEQERPAPDPSKRPRQETVETVQPAPEPSEQATDPARPAEAEETGEPVVAPAPMPGSPRGTIRGRWGSRGRYRPAEAPPPIFEGQRSPKAKPKEETPEASSDGSHTDVGHSHIIEHLKNHYPGVGEKTAETLVETFGADLFRVMDEQPDRVRTVLPDHRADRVLEARRREREAENA